jgi:hypothetical protein
MRSSLTPECFGTGAYANVAVLEHLCKQPAPAACYWQFESAPIQQKLKVGSNPKWGDNDLFDSPKRKLNKSTVSQPNDKTMTWFLTVHIEFFRCPHAVPKWVLRP